MTTFIKTSRNIPCTMSLIRDTQAAKYKVVFAGVRATDNIDEEHSFEQYSDAWNCFARNMHYYNNVTPVPMPEEQFLGLPRGFLYGQGGTL